MRPAVTVLFRDERTCRTHRHLLLSSCANAAGRLDASGNLNPHLCSMHLPARKLEPLNLLCAGGIRISGPILPL